MDKNKMSEAMVSKEKYPLTIKTGLILYAILTMFIALSTFFLSKEYYETQDAFHQFEAKLELVLAQHAPIQQTKSHRSIRLEQASKEYSLDMLIKMSMSMDFEDVFTVATYPEPPEEILCSIAKNVDSSVNSHKEIEELTLALLSAPNSSTKVLSFILNSLLIFDVLDIVTSSELNDEYTLYLCATLITKEGNTREFPTSAVNCIRNPLVTKETLAELMKIDNQTLRTIINQKFDSMP